MGAIWHYGMVLRRRGRFLTRRERVMFVRYDHDRAREMGSGPMSQFVGLRLRVSTNQHSPGAQANFQSGQWTPDE